MLNLSLWFLYLLCLNIIIDGELLFDMLWVVVNLKLRSIFLWLLVIALSVIHINREIMKRDNKEIVISGVFF